MKLDKINSLNVALAAFTIVALIVAGVSYSRQKQAESQVAVLVGAIQSAPSLESLQGLADDIIAYSGAGSSASAKKRDDSCNSGWVATHGSDAGACIGSQDQKDRHVDKWWSDWWPF